MILKLWSLKILVFFGGFAFDFKTALWCKGILLRDKLWFIHKNFKLKFKGLSFL
jgi:hypothetical protein